MVVVVETAVFVLGRPEGVLFLSAGSKCMFVLWFFSKWDGFHGRVRRGPGVSSIHHVFHRRSNRRDRWSGPVRNCWFCGLRVPGDAARIAGWVRNGGAW